MSTLTIISVPFATMAIIAIFLPLQGTNKYTINFSFERLYEADATFNHSFIVPGTVCRNSAILFPDNLPDKFFQELMKKGIKNNLLFRQLAAKLDDYFCGPEPAAKPVSQWLNI